MVTEVRQKFAAGQQGLGIEVINTLKDWLVNHIQHKDKACMDEVCAATRTRRPPQRAEANRESRRRTAAETVSDSDPN
jgi:hemerythrin